MDVPTLFASNLRTFSNNAITDLQYAGLTRDEALSREALQVAAGLFDMWDQRPKRLQDEEWTEEAAVMEADLAEERDDGASVAPEVVEVDGASESARSVWRPADEPATEFERVTRRVGELRELEAGMADYAATCEQELAAMRFELLRLQTTLGETRRLQGALIEARREAEEALWDISAFE
ncbi:hypothetical protein C0991_010346 [Blastosporella zonata]|nr:hypothetical protein C0991_010346 [Blastosporella zonata]